MPSGRRSFVLACLAAAGRAQEEQVIFSTSVKVVNVLATVRGGKGEFVTDLKKEDFKVLEDGRPQEIRYFTQQSDLPLTLGLLVDTSMSQDKVLIAERAASFRFLERVLRETMDKVFILQFDMKVSVMKGLTANRRDLEEALALVDTPTRNELRNYEGSKGTVLFDAVITAVEEFTRNVQGRKALIILSDGVDVGSEATLEQAVDSAQRGDTLIYSIYFTDPRFYGGGGPDGKRMLMKLASDTGGGYYEVTKKLSIDTTFDAIQSELRSQYSIGYVSDKPVRVSEFRRIQLATNRKGLTVQARQRYWAKR
ncbi:MAG: VWA domain-containing protein [Acidobacteria bacterium]|nr:VWA domain-containing protein [Acidobacteriota bacterium]